MSVATTRQAATAAASFASSRERLLARLVDACRSSDHLLQIHAQIVRQGLEQRQIVVSRLLCRCGALSLPISHAREVFDRVSAPNLCLWNTLLKLHAESSPLSCALDCFKSIQRRAEVRPDAFTFPPIFKACSAVGERRTGAALHGTVFRLGLEADLFVGTALIDFHGKCGDILSAGKLFSAMKSPNVVSWTAMIGALLIDRDLVSARKLFDEIPQKNSTTWNVMIDGCIKLGDLRVARQLFDEMPERGVVAFTSLIDGYAKAGDMAAAGLLFRSMNVKDFFSWSAMISGYSQNGQPGAAIRTFLDMLRRSEEVKPDAHVVVGLLSACTQLGCLSLARWADSMASRFLQADPRRRRRPHLTSALIDMNAKCGNLERAVTLFDELPERTLLNFCSMMQGYSFHGHGAAAVRLFERLQAEGLTPDAVTFTVVLAVCNYSGLTEQGRRFFSQMKDKFLISPSADHYACMVDMLAKAGSLREAYELVLCMKEEAHGGVWGAFLRGCCVFGEVKLGEIAAEKLFELEPGNGGNYVLLSNIYAAADRWEDVFKVRRRMREQGIRKVPGCSWV
ncbi:pentatricopeptide repeat (PPR-like) superfamily protein [Wolffia australiana]